MRWFVDAAMHTTPPWIGEVHAARMSQQHSGRDRVPERGSVAILSNDLQTLQFGQDVVHGLIQVQDTLLHEPQSRNCKDQFAGFVQADEGIEAEGLVTARSCAAPYWPVPEACGARGAGA
jgi:hypothetical protein